MNLFDKLKNKRSSLQEKKDDEIKKPTKKANKEVFDVTGKSAARDAKKYSSGEYPKIGGGERMSPKSKGPGASTGGTNTPPATVGGKSKGTTPVKVNITKPVKQSEVSKKAKEFTQNLKKIKGTKTGKSISTGDIGFTAPDRKTKVAKRTTRAIKQGTPDPFKSKTKFSQKGFEKSLKKSSKGPGTGIVDPFKGSEITQGQANVKDMQRSAFRKTQPRDVKLPKSFTDFSKKLKTYKTDVAKTTSATPRTVTKKYKPTTTVKQSEVSQKAKDFTKQINQNRTSSGTPMRAGATNVPKDAAKDIQISKMKDRIKELGGQREKLSSATGKKDVTTIRKVNKEIKQLTKSANTRPFVPTVYNKKNIGATSGAKKVPNTFKTFPTAGGNKVTQSTRSLTAKNKGSVTYNPPSKGVSSPPLSPKGKKFVSKIPGFLKKNKTLARIGKAAVKNPYVAGAVGVGLAAAGAYAGYKAFQNRNKRKQLTYKDFKSLSTPSDPDKGKIIHTRDIPKMNIKKGDVAKFPSPNKIPKSTSAEFKSNYAYK